MTLRQVLVEISVTGQRYQAVLDLRAGSTVTDVAGRFGVSRQAVHRWLAWYEREGLVGRTVTVEEVDTTFRVYDGDQLLAEVMRTCKQVARFKARKPEPPRQRPAI